MSNWSAFVFTNCRSYNATVATAFFDSYGATDFKTNFAINKSTFQATKLCAVFASQYAAICPSFNLSDHSTDDAANGNSVTSTITEAVLSTLAKTYRATHWIANYTTKLFPHSAAYDAAE